MVLSMDNFLDLWDIWVNELVGDVWLFIFLGIIIIAFISIKAKLPTEVTILLEMLFLIIVFAKATGLMVLWVFILLGAGLIFYYFYQKTIRQG